MLIAIFLFLLATEGTAVLWWAGGIILFICLVCLFDKKSRPRFRHSHDEDEDEEEELDLLEEEEGW